MPSFNPENEFKDIKRKVSKAVSDALSMESGDTKIRVHNVYVDDKRSADDVADQKKAILRELSWQVPIKADLSYERKGKTIDRREITVGHLPKLTDRYGFIVNGNEYQGVSLFRLKPGVYHRRAQNDLLNAEYNLPAGGKIRGRSFKVILDPETAQFSFKHGNSSIPLYHLLKNAGVSDKELEKAWGKKVLNLNKERKGASEKAILSRFYKAMEGKKPQDPFEHRDLFSSVLIDTKLSKETTMRTLGKDHSRVTPGTIVDSTKRLLSMSKGTDQGDDKNSLEFLSIHSSEDLISERIAGFTKRIHRKALKDMKDKRSLRNLKVDDLVDKAIRGFFNSSLSQQSEQTNPLYMVSGHRKTTIVGEQGGIQSDYVISEESKLINPSHMGFLDPIHTPEGARTGVNLTIPLLASKIGNELMTSLVNRKTGKLEKVDGKRAVDSIIGFPDQFVKKGGKWVPISKRIKASKGGEMLTIDASKVDYIIPSPRGIFSVASNLIPFLQNNQGNRAMTAARQQEQAVPLEHREAPLVQVRTDGNNTFEDIMGEYASLRSPLDGVVDSVGKDRIVIRSGRKKHTVQMYDDFPLKGHTIYSSQPVVKKGQRVKKGQLLADTSFTKGGKLALGTNLRTAYMPFHGYNFEDGIVISESAAKKLTSLHSYRKDVQASDRVIVDRSKFLAEFPYVYKKGQVENIGDTGVIEVGSKVSPGDPIFLSLRKPNLTELGKKLKKFRRGRPDKMRDSSLSWDKEHTGIVTDVVRKGKQTIVYIKTKEAAIQGDKLVGRHGNKGIITKIVPDSEMPFYQEDGKKKIMQILLNPLGVPGRINLGQILETGAGRLAEKKGVAYKVRNFEPGKDYLEHLKGQMASEGIEDKVPLINPRTGKPYEEKVFVGNQYILKQKHQVQKKMSARSGGPGMPYDVNHAPASGKFHGGQSLGELGTYVMLAHGARENLHEMLNYKSNRNDEVWDALREGAPLPPPKTPFVFEKFLSYMNAMRMNVKKEGNSLVLSPFTEKQITGKGGLSNGELKEPGLEVLGKNNRPEVGGLFDEEITGGIDGKKWSHFKLAEKMPNPLFEDAIRKLTGLSSKEYRNFVSGKSSYKGARGGEAIEKILKSIDVDEEIEKLTKDVMSARSDKRSKIRKKLKILRALKRNNMDPTVYMMSSVPVVPPVFRPVVIKDNGDISRDDLNGLYKDIGALNDVLKTNKSMDMPDELLEGMRGDMYDGLKALTGLGGSLTRKGKYKGIMDILAGKTRSSKETKGSPKDGFFQKAILKRRQDFSGRSTIVPEPNMGLDEIGLPEKMAWTMYDPFVQRKLIQAGYKVLDAQEEVEKKSVVARKALEKAVGERPLLLKRDPALHMFNILAFKPRLVSGNALEIHPLVTSGFNADFDGDTMAVFLPITAKASKEAEGMYPTNNLFSSSTGKVQYVPGHEALLGLYMATQPGRKTNKSYKTFGNASSDFKRGRIKYTDIVRVGGKETTLARMELEKILPEEFKETGKVPVHKMSVYTKKKVSEIFTKIGEKYNNDFGEVANRFKDIGNNYSTSLGFSVGLKDFEVINRGFRDKLISTAEKEADEVRKNPRLLKRKKDEKIIGIFSKVYDKLDAANSIHLKKNPTNIYRMIVSGARGSPSQLKQIVSSPILVKDGKDRTVPYIIPRSYSEGMDIASYWTAMHGARKGTVQKVQGVKDPGYISKQILQSSMNQLVTEKDCGTSRGVYMDVDEIDILDRRVATDTSVGPQKFERNTLVTPRFLSAAKKTGRKRFLVRSPLRCEAAHGICQSCAGNKRGNTTWDIGTNLGILAGQAIGEPSTQLSMNVFHGGGLAKGKGAESQGTFRTLEQLVRMPKKLPNRTPLSELKGTVSAVRRAPQGGHNVFINKTPHYIPSTQDVTVFKGQKIEKGERLSNGLEDPRDILRLRGMDSVQDHLTDKIKGIFKGIAPIKRRNIEVVVRAITNLTKVEDSGDHPTWLPGDMKPRNVVRSWNRKNPKRRVKHTPTLKGVNVLPLEMQEDWIARMGYNNIHRTLKEAAWEGWKSNIHGFHPTPAMAFGKEFGKKVKVKDWRGQY